jgi:hypothetical protein
VRAGRFDRLASRGAPTAGSSGGGRSAVGGSARSRGPATPVQLQLLAGECGMMQATKDRHAHRGTGEMPERATPSTVGRRGGRPRGITRRPALFRAPGLGRRASVVRLDATG